MSEETRVSGLYSLETVSELVGLPRTRVIRYVRVGLVRPQQERGRRPLFAEDDLHKLRRIRRLSEDMGLNLAGIEVAMRLLDEIAALRAALEQRQT